MADEERLELRSGQHQAAHLTGGDDIRDRRHPDQDRDLAEEVTALEPSELPAIGLDPSSSVDDDEEPGAGQALVHDRLALGEHPLVEYVDDRLELSRGQVGKQPEAGDRVDEFVAVDHDAHRATWTSRAFG